MQLIIPDYIKTIVPYPPGKPQDELEREYGVKNSIKLASNENPWGPSPKAIAAVHEAVATLNRYPDGASYYLTQALAAHHGLDTSEIVLGNGSNEMIEFLVKAFIREGLEVICSHPSFLMYEKFTQMRGGRCVVAPLAGMHHNTEAVLAAITVDTRLIFLDNPNNPSGSALTPLTLCDFLARVPEHVVVALDEAYIDFAGPELHLDIHALIRGTKNRCPVVFLRTFSKAYGLPALRVGYGLMPREIAACLHKVRQAFNINSLAQAGALAALNDQAYFRDIVARNRRGRQFLVDHLSRLGCDPLPSETNFIFFDIHADADRLYEAMLYRGVIIRSMRAYGHPSCLRVTVGTDEENTRFLTAIEECLREIRA
ncbi:MAG TPA: histidinol-phosphate transaminase [Desulfobulbaceae bacterium]|nr:histidinol-phosphate transaminase [Desulfobulbaceae bacterium]